MLQDVSQYTNTIKEITILVKAVYENIGDYVSHQAGLRRKTISTKVSNGGLQIKLLASEEYQTDGKLSDETIKEIGDSFSER